MSRICLPNDISILIRELSIKFWNSQILKYRTFMSLILSWCWFISGHLAWHQILSYSRMRKQYVSKYIETLQANPKGVSVNDNKDIKELDRQLDSEIIIQWR